MMHSFRHHFGKSPWFFLYDVIIYFYAPIGCIGLTLFTHDTRRKRRFLVPTQNKKSNYKIIILVKNDCLSFNYSVWQLKIMNNVIVYFFKKRENTERGKQRNMSTF
jgi:hypothetical protein